MVYEADADCKDSYGAEPEESFAQKYLWSRSPADLKTEEGMERNGELNGDAADEGQFKIEDSDSEEDEPADEGARAFKATVGHPLKQQNGETGPSEPINDPLSKPDDEPNVTDEDQPMMPCLVDKLFSCTIDLLFCSGFTVPESVRGQTNSQEKVNVSSDVPLA